MDRRDFIGTSLAAAGAMSVAGTATRASAAGKQSVEKLESGIEQSVQFEKQVVEMHQIGHFCLFALLCFLVYLSAALERQHLIYFAKVGIDVLIFAAITESVQFLTLDRKAGVADLLTDIYGMATALVLFLAVLPFVRHYQGLASSKVG